MKFYRSRPQYRKLPSVLAGILAAMAIAGPLPMEGAGQAAEQQEVASQERLPTFKLQVERNLVPVRVIVRDRQGRAVGGLRKEDFRLFDNRKPQVITHFSVETPTAEAKPAPPEAGPESAAPPRPSAIPQWRYLALFFDDLHLGFKDLARARDAADRFLARVMGPSDRVGIFTASGLVRVDFTDDRAQLHEALFKLRPNPRIDPRLECPEISDYQAEQIVKWRDEEAIAVVLDEALHRCPGKAGRREVQAAPRSAYEQEAGRREVQAAARRAYEQYQYQAHLGLQNLDQLARHMATLPGQRHLILVSGGFLPLGLQSLVGGVVDRALRSNVIISSLDPRGMPVLLRETDASRGYMPGGALAGSIHTLESARERAASALVAQFAQETGGEFFHNDNDLDAGFAKVTTSPEVYYTLAFSPRKLKYNGRFHHLKVELVNRKGLSVMARRGYFAPRKLPDAVGKVSEEVEAAAFSLDELKELPVEVRPQVLKSGNGKGRLGVLVHVDIGALSFRRERDRNANELMFVTVVFDLDGKYVDGKQSQIDLRLRDATLEKARASGIDLRTSFTLKPGVYLIREVVRDSKDGHLAALNSMVEVPSHPPDLPQEPVRTSPRERELAHYQNARSVLDWTPSELRHNISGLKKLKVSQTQGPLPFILQKVGENVAAFFRDFPNVASTEKIRILKYDSYGRLVDGLERKFRFVVVACPDEIGVCLEEYRTDDKGKTVEQRPLPGLMSTVGYAMMPVLFHPLYQPGSKFRYLGRVKAKGREHDVVGFAQVPEKAKKLEWLSIGDWKTVFAVQGVAWIDTTSFQITRMRVDLLAPRKDIGLDSLTTVIQFGEIHFRESPVVVWLPQHVDVTVNWRGRTFRNAHQYSDFRLFRVEVTTR